MFARAKKIVMTSLAVGTALALAGCGVFVVDNPDGSGSCGSDAVTLVTGQNASGDTLSIDYTGPDSAVLMLVPGLYAHDDVLFQYFNATNFVFAWGDGNNGDVIRLDTTAPGWTVTGSGAATTYAYSGSASQLFNGAPTWWDTFANAEADLLNDVLPLAIAVDCDNTHTTGSIPISDGWTFTTAQPLYPNNMLLDPFEVLSTATTPTGATATMRYAASATTVFGNFDPQAPSSFNIYQDNPDVPNDTMANLWSQALLGGSAAGTMTVTGTNPDGSFNVEVSGANVGEALPDGSYLLFTIIGNQDLTAAKIVFSSFTYSQATGIAFSNPFVAEPTLPDTGASAGQLGVTGGIAAVLLSLGAVAVLLARRPRARQQ